MASVTRLPRSHPLSQKLHKILSHPLDATSTKRAIGALDTFYEGNTDLPQAAEGDLGGEALLGSSLKADLDARAMEGYRKFLDSFQATLDRLQTIETDLNTINETFEEMENRLKHAKSESAGLLTQTRDLQSLKAKAAKKTQIATAFLDRFTPTDSEVAILTGSAPISVDFFNALNRLSKISEECTVVLTDENQKAGMEIVESIALYQEKALSKLVDWVESQVVANMRKETPELSPIMRKAMAALKSRPSLFQNCIDDIFTMRQETVLQCFMNALTRGGPGGIPRPIELQAHDPIRYVGDMLAWLHQASVGERELVEAMLLSDDVDDIFTTVDFKFQHYKQPDSIYTVLNKCMEMTCRPLKVRIEEVLGSHPGAIVAYKIATTIQFYNHTITRVIGKDNILSLGLNEVYVKAFEVFMKALESQTFRIRAFIQKPSKELTPPPAVKEAVFQLRELLSAYESGILTETDTSARQVQEETLEKILRASLDPLLLACTEGAGIAGLGKFESAMYATNCIYFIQSTMALFDFMDNRIKKMQTRLEIELGVIIAEQYEMILQKSGLKPLVDSMDDNLGKVPLAYVPLLDPRSVASIMSSLDVYLCTAGFDAQSRLSPLLSARQQQQCLESVFAAFLATYKRLHDAVMDPANKFEFPASILRPVEEIHTLLVT